MTNLRQPLHSLKEGSWFKLICGASFQHLSAIRNLTLVYSLAGADCIDVAADAAVVEAAREGIEAARSHAEAAQRRGFDPNPAPWLMVSLNDAEDPHFRKAEFDPNRCPPDCSRPCQSVCPAAAIAFNDDQRGVIDQRCYGCGRCLPICPYGLISARSYVCSLSSVVPSILSLDIDAIEIHTQPGQFDDFQRLWQVIEPQSHRLQQIAVSCPNTPESLSYLRSLYDLLAPDFPHPIWQTDGRSMSGDIGKGTTKATIEYGQKVLQAQLPGYVQLAGGTNHYTVPKLKNLNLLNPEIQNSKTSAKQCSKFPKPDKYIAGVAYGSYARSLLAPVLDRLEAVSGSNNMRLEKNPELLWSAVEIARSLVGLHKGDRQYSRPPLAR